MASIASLSFDGVNDAASVADFSALPFDTGDFTVEAWYKDLNASNLNHARYTILAHGDRGITNTDCFFAVGFRNVEFIYKNGGTTYTLSYRLDTAPEAYTINQWIHLAATYDATNRVIRLYVDGSLRATSAALGAGPPSGVTEDLTIGAADNGASRINFALAKIDEVRVWNVRRTDTEISTNYNKELTGLEANLVAYYRMEEGSNSTLADAANSHDMAITGATWDTADFPTITDVDDWFTVKHGHAGGGGTGGTASWVEGGSATSGNLLVAVVTTRAANIDIPSGWTRGPEGINTTNNDRCVIVYKRSDGTETGFTVTHTGGVSDTWAVKIYEIKHSAGFDSNPLDVSVGHNGAPDDTKPVATGTTPSAASGGLAIAVVQLRDPLVFGMTWTNDFRQKYFEDETSHAIVVGHKLLTSAGTVQTDLSWDDLGTSTPGAVSAIAVFKPSGGGGTNESTLTGTPTIGDATVTGSLQFTTPVYTITGTVQAGAATVGGSLTNTPPTSIISGTVTPGEIVAAGSLTVGPPVHTLSGNVTPGAIDVDGSIQWTNPVYQFSGNAVVEGIVVAGSLAVTHPVYTINGAVAPESPTVSGSVLFSSSLSILDGTVQVGQPTVIGAVDFDTPVYAVSGTFQVSAPSVTGALNNTHPVYNVFGTIQLGAPTVTGQIIAAASSALITGELSVQPPTVEGSLTVSIPVVTISGAIAVQSPEVNGTITAPPPVYTIDGVVNVGAVTVTGTLIFVAPGTAPAVVGPLSGTVRPSKYYGIVRGGKAFGKVK